ncbi:DoxX family protein [Streptomyces sp. URMC 129]|uniref:DoxX family protein n=1 Tax=Streptomyces sp. URMC 129 TaxID=3423407 RepID=UPI003F1BBFEE
MDILVLIGRILYVMVFFTSAAGHLTQTAAMAGYAQSKGVPAAKAAVLGTGVLQVVGALSVLLGVWADLGALLLALFLLPTALLMHAFWKETDPGSKQNEMIHFFKDIGLAGASLMLCALIAFAGDELGLTLTGPLFDLD